MELLKKILPYPMISNIRKKLSYLHVLLFITNLMNSNFILSYDEIVFCRISYGYFILMMRNREAY